MRRARWIVTLAGLATLVSSPLAATPALAVDFGFKDADVTFIKADGSPATQAGSHPFEMTTTLDFNTEGETAVGEFKDLVVDLPPGLVGDPMAVPRCSNADFLTFTKKIGTACPDAAAVGVVGIRQKGKSFGEEFAPVYNLEPPPGTPAMLGFHALIGVAVTMKVGVREDGERNLFATLGNVPQAEPATGSELTIWGEPADPAHDPLRGHCFRNGGSIGNCPAAIPRRPFLTLPRSCNGPLTTTFKARSWQDQETWIETVATTRDQSSNPLGTTGCDKLGFHPMIAARPTTRSAESAAGLDFNLDIEDEGLVSSQGTAKSDVRDVVATLPEGMTVNPSAAEGLGVCTRAQYEREHLGAEAGEGCPESSKIGSVRVETPLLENRILQGALYVAQQDDPATSSLGAENPFDSLLALYVVVEDRDLGIFVKQAGKVEPDPLTGQLVSTFEGIPQLPFSHFMLHFREGDRSSLVTPAACGTYSATADFTPWSNPDKRSPATSLFQIDSGIGGGPCPTGGAPPFRSSFEAGSINNNAGSYSPFYMRLTRFDGEQDMTRFDSILPPGVVGKIASVAKCSDAAIEAAKGKSGREEVATPSCPRSSQIGGTVAGAGVGAALTYVPGQIYLGGPFGGDPLSIVAITPAVAGPFDAGTVVVRQALTLDPETAEVQVDGSHSDPIPHILKGIPLKLRDLRVFVDRKDFTLNPTSCDPMATKATLFGGFLNVFSSGDDIPVALSSRYQAANCASLDFKPKFSFSLAGGTRRGDHPALKAVVTPRAGDANFASAVVTLPHSAFLEQAHIRTVCTRVQFAAGQCPKGSIYGRARAVTPLLDEPLEGPVYLRSSSHPLPDLVVSLHGVVDINLVGRIDSVNARIRSSFESIPDAPVTKFALEMQGGKKGLVVNSRNLCSHKSHASAEVVGQNGKLTELKPLVRATNCGKSSNAKRLRAFRAR